MKKVLFLLGFTLLAACASGQQREVASNDQQCVSGSCDDVGLTGYAAHFVGRSPMVHY